MASWKTADRPLHSGSAEVSAELQDRIQAIKVPPPVQEPADIIFPADNQHRVEDIAIPPALASDQAAKQQPVLAGKVQLVGAGQAPEKREIATSFGTHQGHQATNCKEMSTGAGACKLFTACSAQLVCFTVDISQHVLCAHSCNLQVCISSCMLRMCWKTHPSN